MRQAEYIKYRLRTKCPTMKLQTLVKRLALELQISATAVILAMGAK